MKAYEILSLVKIGVETKQQNSHQRLTEVCLYGHNGQNNQADGARFGCFKSLIWFSF